MSVPTIVLEKNLINVFLDNFLASFRVKWQLVVELGPIGAQHIGQHMKAYGEFVL